MLTIHKHIQKKYRENTKTKPYNFKTKIIKYDFYAKNEGFISDCIKNNCLYYSNYFFIVEDYEFINISKINHEMNNPINDIYFDKINNTDKYLLFKYKKERIIEFLEMILFKDNSSFSLYSHLHEQKYFFHMINSFSYLLQSLIHLNNINICYFHLCPENIVFHADCGMKPFLHNFQLSFHVSHLKENYFIQIIERINNFIYQPLEVHLLFYIIRNNIKVLTDSLINQIAKIFINNLRENLQVQNILPDFFFINYEKKCLVVLNKYLNININMNMNLDKTNIISHLLNYNNKWDVYSLSIIYLQLFSLNKKICYPFETYTNNFISLLVKNMHPDPIERNTLHEFKDAFEELYDFFV